MRKNPPTTCAWLEGREKRLFKVQILWEGHKIKKKFPTLFWNYLVCNIKTNWNIFKLFVAFSEYLNFRPLKEKKKKQFLAKLHWKRRVVVQ
jgi:hypothetical protein